MAIDSSPHSSFFPLRHVEHVRRSREQIVGTFGNASDLVFVRGYGNFGDELIWAGVRNLLCDHLYREIGAEDLSGASGHTALICGGGAFCHSFHDIMPHVLAIAESKFERVIVLPSTFDTSVDAVREVLQRTKAIVFAREQESYRQIQPLCDARLAHDTAFFFDYEPYRQTGSGILHAFRTDSESLGKRLLPSDNDDISVTAGTLDDWLRMISRHAVVQTDRAHVMIAAALLGKEVEFESGSYFKVPAIAEYALRDFPVRRLAPASSTRSAVRSISAPGPPRDAPGPPRERDATRERLRTWAHGEAGLSVRQSVRARLAGLLPRGRTRRVGSISVQRRWDGLLVGPAAAHPVYGSSYEKEPLPPGLTPDELREYVGRIAWYHEIDLGNGVLTPGMKSQADIAREWEVFSLSELAGKSVLDVGGIDGAYAFLAEHDGASRVAVLDHYLWATDAEHYRRIYHEHVDTGTTPPAPHESDAWHPDTTPTRWRFDTARQALGSRVEGIALDFADCDLAEIGKWDIVLYLGVLYHMPDPVRALRRLAAITREQAIIETEAMFVRGHPEALWRFFPAGELNYDRSNWWVPNIDALMGLVGAAGFSNAEILSGEPSGDQRPGDGPHHYRAIVRAIK